MFSRHRAQPAVPATSAATAAETTLPRGLGWAVLDNGSDLMVVIPVFSASPPTGAEFQLLDQAPAISNGDAAAAALVVRYGDGSQRRLALTRHDDTALVERLAGMPDFVISETSPGPGPGTGPGPGGTPYT